VSTLVLHPLDLLKTRGAAGRVGGLWEQCKQIWKCQGARGFYHGMSPNMALSGLSWGIYFLSYNAAKNRLEGQNGGSVAQAAAAVEAGVITMMVTNPLQVVRTRMVLSTSPCGMLALATSILHREGPAALFKGFTPNMIGVSHGTLQLVLYETLKEKYQASKLTSHNLGSFEHVGLAALSKMVASLATYPCQVVRTVLQDVPQVPGTNLRARDVASKLWQEKGTRGLYRGIIPHLMHVTPNICIIFAMYEAVAGEVN